MKALTTVLALAAWTAVVAAVAQRGGHGENNVELRRIAVESSERVKELEAEKTDILRRNNILAMMLEDSGEVIRSVARRADDYEQLYIQTRDSLSVLASALRSGGENSAEVQRIAVEMAQRAGDLQERTRALEIENRGLRVSGREWEDEALHNQRRYWDERARSSRLARRNIGLWQENRRVGQVASTLFGSLNEMEVNGYGWAARIDELDQVVEDRGDLATRLAGRVERLIAALDYEQAQHRRTTMTARRAEGEAASWRLANGELRAENRGLTDDLDIARRQLNGARNAMAGLIASLNSMADDQDTRQRQLDGARDDLAGMRASLNRRDESIRAVADACMIWGRSLPAADGSRG